MSTSMPPPGSTLHGHGSTIRSRAITIATEVLQGSARDIAYVLFRHKWVIAVFFLLTVSSVALYTFTSPEVFESEAQLLMRLGRENMAVDPAEGRSLGLAQNRDNEINSELSILTSRVLAEQVVDAAGESAVLPAPETAPGFKEKTNALLREAMSLPLVLLAAVSPPSPLSARDQAVDAVEKNLTVEVEKKTNIITAKYDSKTPEGAQQALAKLIDLYLERHIQVYQSQTTPQFFETQAAQLAETLTKKEQERDEYRAKYGIAELTKQKEALIQQVSAMQTTRSTAEADARSSEARLKALRAALKDHPKEQKLSETVGMANPTADKLKSDLADLQMQEKDMAARYPGTYRPLTELRDRIKQAEKMLSGEKDTLTTVTTGLDANYLQLQLSAETEETQLKASEARQAALTSELAQLQGQLAELTSRESEMTRMERDADIAEKEYREYREGLQRAKVSAALDIDKVSNVSIVQPATLSPVPVKPQKVRNLALGLFLGIFGGVFLAFGLEYLDARLHTKEDVENKLGLPVLAVITDKEFRSL